VRRPEIEAFHRDVSKATPVRANRALSLLRKMFNLAIGWQIRSDNPCRGIERNHENKRDRYLTPAELERLMVAIASHPNQASANVVRLTLLTGARRSEILSAAHKTILDALEMSDLLDRAAIESRSGQDFRWPGDAAPVPCRRRETSTRDSAVNERRIANRPYRRRSAHRHGLRSHRQRADPRQRGRPRTTFCIRGRRKQEQRRDNSDGGTPDMSVLRPIKRPPPSLSLDVFGEPCGLRNGAEAAYCPPD
jgi:hypothetical protein